MQKRNLDFFSFDIQRTNKNKLKYKSRTCLLFFFLLCNRFVIYQCYIAHTCIKKLFEKINECHPSIKSEYEISKTEVSYLNTTMLKADNKLRTKVYVEPLTDKVIYTTNQNIHL